MGGGYSTEGTARVKSLFQIKASKHVGGTARGSVDGLKWARGRGKDDRLGEHTY